jgi:4-amino-4-deoxychorismate lyase
MQIQDGFTVDISMLISRSCLYGDGLFETMAYRGGDLRYWSYHWSRLQQGLQRLLYPIVSEVDVLAVLQPQLDALTTDAVIRLTVTRRGARGYRVTPDAQVDIDVQVSPFPTQCWHGRNIKARWCTTTWAQQPLLAGIKHLNRLEQVLARSEWTDVSIEEGLVCDTAGHVISGTMSSLLVRHGKRVFAADIRQVGIDSVARRVVMNTLPELGYSLQVRNLSRQDIMNADEIVMMNSIQGVGFISECDGFLGVDNQLTLSVSGLF